MRDSSLKLMGDCTSKNSKLPRVLAVVAFSIIVSVEIEPTFGQRSVPAARRGSGQLGSTLRSAINYRGGIFGGSGLRGGATSAAGRGFARSSASAAQQIYGGRPRSRSTVYMPGTQYAFIPGHSLMLSYLGRTQTAAWFSAPTFAGNRNPAMALRPTYGTPETAGMVQRVEELALLNSYHYKMYQPLEGGGIRDSMTNLSLENTVETPEEIEKVEFRTHAERLAALVQAKHGRYLDQGWSYLREGDYLRGRNAFGSAALVKSDDLDAKVGQLICTVLNEQLSTAVVLLEKINRQDDDPFRFNRKFTEILPESNVSGTILTDLAVATKSDKTDDKLIALRAFLLWLDGQTDEAVKVADDLKDRFRASPFASFADKMREHT